MIVTAAERPEESPLQLASLKRGNGDVGRFLDSLSRRCVVVNVCNARLAAMLKRRGWECRWVLVEEFGDKVDEWRRPCA